MRRIFWIAFIGLWALTAAVSAETRPTATFADYGQWETLVTGGSQGGFSPDGRWIAYGINRSDRNNELRIVKLAGRSAKVFAFGQQPVFSPDSKWAAFAIGLSEAEQEKLKGEKKPAQNKLGLLDLATGETTTFEGIEAFSFSRDGAFLAMRRYGPAGAADAGGRGGPGGGRGGTDTPVDEAPGTTLLVRNLAAGQNISFGNVSQSAWQDLDQTHLLAMIINAEGKTGNGVQLYDPRSGLLRVLDSAPAVYSHLSWRKDAADLAVLRARTDDRKEGPGQDLLAWTGLGRAERRFMYDPSADKAFPPAMRIVSFRRPSWSDDGQVVFFGIAAWDDKIPPAAPQGGVEQADRPSTVEIWHWKDVQVMPWQKINADTLRRRNVLSAWHPASGKFVQIGRDPAHEEVRPIPKTGLAWVAEWSIYAMNRSIGRPAADLYLADTTTGARTKVAERIIESYVQPGPSGKYLLFLRDDGYWTVDLTTRAVTNVGGSAPTSFINLESDQTSIQKPPFGTAGWTEDDAAVLLYDKYDLWRVPADGSRARRLTDGTPERIRHRLVRLDGTAGGPRGDSGPASVDSWVDLGRPVYLSLHGDRSKKSGYAVLKPGAPAERLLWLDKGVGSLAKAKAAEVYGYVVQDYDDSPDIFVAGADLKNPSQVTETNPFQSRFAWGRSELVEFRTDNGQTLQGALYYPAGYESGKKYPMIVYNYELLSQNVHRYVAPDERSYYNTSVFLSHGYFILQPDIVFRPRQPGVSVVRCVTAAVRKVIDMGLVDPGRVGIIGHSMGGFNTSFAATHTRGVFAAAVAGAAITDLVSYFGDHHWSSGIAETDHMETGQERMVVPLYEDLQAYIDNSATFNVHNMTVPLLLEVGDNDGTVPWRQGIELYNIARRAGKNVVMLAYMGEDHGLRQKSNQIDYQRRILAWFGHYLKGEAPQPWIVDGLSYLDREREVQRQTAKKDAQRP